MTDFRAEIPDECSVPQCEDDAEYIETSLLITVCPQHMEMISGKLSRLTGCTPEWRSLNEPLDDIDVRQARVNIERTILTLTALTTKN